jgi:hypothetical protein
MTGEGKLGGNSVCEWQSVAKRTSLRCRFRFGDWSELSKTWHRRRGFEVGEGPVGSGRANFSVVPSIEPNEFAMREMSEHLYVD